MTTPLTPSAVTQQTLQAFPVVAFYAHSRVEGEASAVLPGTHGLRVFALEQSAPGERPQKTDAELGLDFGQRFGTEAVGGVKTHRLIGLRLEAPLNYA